jgi:hypothetical protein
MMSDLSELLEAERKRLARKPKTEEQRDRERHARRWWQNLQDAWSHAYLLSDEELQWLAAVTDATRDKPARISRNPWTGNRVITRRPPRPDDAVRLEKLHRELWYRKADEDRRLRLERRQQVAERLARFGLQADRYSDLDQWAAIDRYRGRHALASHGGAS